MQKDLKLYVFKRNVWQICGKCIFIAFSYVVIFAFEAKQHTLTLFLKTNNIQNGIPWKITFEKTTTKFDLGQVLCMHDILSFFTIFIDLIVWFIICCCVLVYLAIFYPNFCLLWMTHVLLSMLSESFGVIISYGIYLVIL